MSEHTKGDKEGMWGVFVKYDEYNQVVYRILNTKEPCSDDERKANARLIAAAPKTAQHRDKLLAACEDFVNSACVSMIVAEVEQKHKTSSELMGLVIVLKALQNKAKSAIAGE